MGTDTGDVPRRAWELREDLRGRGEFTTRAYLQELALAVPEVPAEALRALAERVDRESTRERPRTGMFDLEGEFRLRHGRRVAKARALLAHWQEAIAVSAEELAGWTERI